ncbi:Glyceraldehyde-3-phosphate dehydrogenase [Galemys pyrenaicus]|uniref:Glyceraldehyde-3-phosphate dehydrogenase n=1 Tax=Galemys pyrenaicus TaxID=202257 RepID=A0A8J6DJI4_GALPY|nr:Glyceraldehyde-3-phosphate dehydrogenase [Galemys pyrenaicus]
MGRGQLSAPPSSTNSHLFSCHGNTSLRHRGEGGENRFSQTEHLVTRDAFRSGKVSIVVINDPFTELTYMVYMFQNDSTHHKFNGTVKAKNRKLVINNKSISIFQEQDPSKIKWGDDGTEYVIESIIIFTILKKAWAH